MASAVTISLLEVCKEVSNFRATNHVSNFTLRNLRGMTIEFKTQGRMRRIRAIQSIDDNSSEISLWLGEIGRGREVIVFNKKDRGIGFYDGHQWMPVSTAVIAV